MSEALMDVHQISVKFGGLWAVKDVSIKVQENEILGIMGPNGAGKSTFLNVLSGLQRPSSGYLQLGQEKLSYPKPWKMAEFGVARSFQTVRLLKEMTVLENVLVGGHMYAYKGIRDVIGRSRRFQNREKELRREAEELLESFGVGHKMTETSSRLSLQERRRVEIARALMTKPKILLLDEPCAGLSPQESQEISTFILDIRKRGVAIVLVEHNVKMVLSLSDRILVLDHGQKIAEGTPTEISKNETVIQAYLGGAVHA